MRCIAPNKAAAIEWKEALPMKHDSRWTVCRLDIPSALLSVLLPALLSALLFAPGARAQMPAADEPPTPEEISIARGGRLYDKWFVENNSPAPATRHPAYPASGTQAPADTWRCKECHGWDYRGHEGTYAKGSHFTGIKGIGAAGGRPPQEIIALLRGPLHRYGPRMLTEHDVQDLANFVSKGQLDYRPYLDERNRLKGNVLRGKSYYGLLCVECHGEEGSKARHGTRLGELHDNGAEILHKLMNGQPGEDMRSLRVIPHRIAVDIGTYVQTLPR